MKSVWVRYRAYNAVKIGLAEVEDVTDLLEMVKQKLENLLKMYDVAQLELHWSDKKLRPGLTIKELVKLLDGNNSDLTPMRVSVLDGISLDDITTSPKAPKLIKEINSTSPSSSTSESSSRSASSSSSGSFDSTSSSESSHSIKSSTLNMQVTKQEFDQDEQNNILSSQENLKSHNTSTTNSSNDADDNNETDESEESNSINDQDTEDDENSVEIETTESLESVQIELVDSDPNEIKQDGWSEHSFHNYIIGKRRK